MSKETITEIGEETARQIGKYYLAWTIASLSTFSLLALVNLAIPAVFDLAFSLEATDENTFWFSLVETPIQIAVWLSVWILVYSHFKSLNIRMVMPWLWLVTITGAALNMLKTYHAVSEPSQVVLLSPLYLFSLVSEVKMFEIYFKSKGRFVD